MGDAHPTSGASMLSTRMHRRNTLDYTEISYIHGYWMIQYELLNQGGC